MPNTPKRRRASLPVAGICLASIFAFSAGLPVSSASAQAQDGGAQAEDPNVKKGRELAAKAFGTMQKVNSACSLAFGLAKAAVNLDPLAVVDLFFDYLLKGDGPAPDIAVRQARDEILAELRKTREEELVARSNSLVSRFAELTDDPDNMLVNDRLANYLDDASDLYSDLELIMKNGDPTRAETVYHLAPTFNTVVTSRIIGLSMAQWSVESMERLYSDAINVNQNLVSDEDQYGGYLYAHAIGLGGRYTCRHAGNTVLSTLCEMNHDNAEWECSTGAMMFIGPEPPICSEPYQSELEVVSRARIDSDPIVYLVRQSATEQQLALF